MLAASPAGPSCRADMCHGDIFPHPIHSSVSACHFCWVMHFQGTKQHASTGVAAAPILQNSTHHLPSQHWSSEVIQTHVAMKLQNAARNQSASLGERTVLSSCCSNYDSFSLGPKFYLMPYSLLHPKIGSRLRK